MGGEGSMQHMINSLRNNKKLLRRKDRFDKEKTFLNLDKENYKIENKPFRSKEASAELLEQIRKEARESRKKWLIFYVVVSIIVTGSVTFFIYNLNQKRIKAKREILRQKAAQAELYKTISFKKALGDAEIFFDSKEWENAANSYYKAYTLKPDNYDVNYKLIEAMYLS